MITDPYHHGKLCRVDELDDPGSKGFSVNARGVSMDILVVRQGNRVYGYLNSCPHTGASLDWMPGQFLDRHREFIQCATHGALFRLVDGLCVYGPCAGEYLTAVAMAVVDGDVVLVTADSESRVARD